MLGIDKQYKYRDKIVRYIGEGNHTDELMFRDEKTGQIVFCEKRDILLVQRFERIK